MPTGEREALSGLITTLIVVATFLWFLTGQHSAGAFAGPDALQLWARLVLKLVGASIAVMIAVTVVVHIVNRMLTGEAAIDHRDERDREIERTALTWAWYLLSVGILGVIVDLALGASAFRAMNLVLALCAASELFKDSLKLWLYRRGA